MKIKERIDAFAELGGILRKAVNGEEDSRSSGLNELIARQKFLNPWFIPEYVTTALQAIAAQLTESNLTTWTGRYPFLLEKYDPVRVGIIMAGNIPLVGFHDFLSVLISGNHLIAKTSSKDSELIVKISRILCDIDPRFSDMIEFTEGMMKGFDSVIATGSNNSSRYFEYYFGRYPHIIRKNRNSIAILDGNESAEEIERLGNDIFLYFGLGCRNVSKILIPEGYDPTTLPPGWESFSGIQHHSKYANNYDFNKAIYLVNREKFLDTGYLLLKEDKGLSSPVSVLYYEYYEPDSYKIKLQEMQTDKIQCIVGHDFIPFGEAQSPYLWDYADGIDTLDFLSKKKCSGIL
jgi:hypothetical protein